MAKSPKPQAETAEQPKTLPPRTRLVEALMELAGERRWSEISITDIATRANVSLGEFRDLFPSKGAILGSWSKMIDHAVLAGTNADLAGEPGKERLFDVLMRRLDAMAPYKNGLQSIMQWVRTDPGAALALNKVALNSMRFMLEAAGIDSEGPMGALKLQGLVLSWTRIVNVWLTDDAPGLDATMVMLDRELTRGGQLVARAEDLGRLTAPLHMFARALCDTRKNMGTRVRERWQNRDAAAPSI